MQSEPTSTARRSTGWPHALGRFVPERHVRAVLLTVCLLPILFGTWLVVILPQSTDVWFYRHWSRLVTLQGISASYAGEYPEGYVDYPPFLLYPWKIVGHLYQWLIDPTFDQEHMIENNALAFGLHMVAVLFHVAIGLAVYWLGRMRYGKPPAATAAALYLLNPAALYNVAYLGLPDTAHSFWLVLAFGMAEVGRVRAGWAAAAVAALTKPQAWGLMPLFGWRQLCVTGVRRTLLGMAVAGVTAAVVIVPFIVNGRLQDFFGLSAHMGSVQPLVSAQAHNLWWLVSFGKGLHIPDATTLVGPVAYWHVALLLLGMSGLLVLWRARTADPETMLTLVPFQAFAWFCLSTRAHENHWFFVLPLLALALPADRRMFLLFVAITATGFINLFLHDEHFKRELVVLVTRPVWIGAQLVNCGLNLSILVVWTVWLVRAPARVRS